MSTIEFEHESQPQRDAAVAANNRPAVGGHQRWAGVLVGAVAALVASAVMLWAGRTWGGVILAQLISERLTEIVPLAVFRRVLDALESDAKPLTLLGITVGQVMVGALLGLGYTFFARSGVRARIAGGLGLGLVVWVLLAVVAAPLAGVGLFAHGVAGSVWRTQMILVLGSLLFGVVTAAGVPWPQSQASTTDDEIDRSRRRLLLAGSVALAAFASGAYVGRYLQDLRRKSPRPAVISGSSGEAFAFNGMPPRITPTQQFYVVSKNLVDPQVDGSSWELEIGGMVDRPARLSLTDLTTRPSSDFTSTLECISNTLGGSYISTAVWRGFTLRSLLEEAGLHAGVVDIELHAADGYVESIPLAEALADDTMLVHTINGQPLPEAHGYPARLIVPGIFGMKNVKWITGIFAVDHDVQGYWQERGWSDIATVVTMTRIDTPRTRTQHPINVPIRFGGVAFAGDRGINAVEVSIDDGATWQPAELDTVVSPLSWRLWQSEFTPTTTGDLFLKARATDGDGVAQIADVRPTLPDGATGYHRIKLTIVE